MIRLLYNIKDNEVNKLDINGIFIAIGMEPISKFVKDLVELDDLGYIKATEEGITSRKGIFVAGDVRTKSLRQVITAASDGAYAINSIEKYLRELNKVVEINGQ